MVLNAEERKAPVNPGETKPKAAAPGVWPRFGVQRGAPLGKKLAWWTSSISKALSMTAHTAQALF